MMNECTTTLLYTCVDTSIVGVPESVPSPLVCPAVGEELPAEDGSAKSEGEGCTGPARLHSSGTHCGVPEVRSHALGRVSV